MALPGIRFIGHEALRLDDLVGALDEETDPSADEPWRAFVGGVLAHLDAKELHLLPLLQEASPRDARVLTQEYAHLRARVAELEKVSTRDALRDARRAFVHEVQAHARSEERLVGPWVDPEPRGTIGEAIASALARIGERNPGARER